MGKNKNPYIIDVTSLIKEVNRCDKDFGVKLKKHNIFNEPESVFKVSVAEAETYISALVVALNGISLDDYFYTGEFGTTHGPIAPEEITFTEMSQFDWTSTSEIDSIEFSCKFVSAFLVQLMYRLDKISLNRFRYSKIKIGMYEHAYFNLKDISDDARRLVYLVLSEEESFSNIFLKMILHSSYAKNKTARNNVKKYNSTILDAIKELKDGLSINVLKTTPFMDDDVAIFTLMRLAFMLATNSQDFKCLPKFKLLLHANRYDDLSCVFEDLGTAIVNNSLTKHGSILFKSFNAANPAIYTNFTCNNEFISIGIRAFIMTSYIINDKRVTKFVKDCIKKIV